MSVFRTTFCAAIASTSLAACANDATSAIHAEQAARVITTSSVEMSRELSSALDVRFNDSSALGGKTIPA